MIKVGNYVVGLETSTLGDYLKVCRDGKQYDPFNGQMKTFFLEKITKDQLLELADYIKNYAEYYK